MPGIVHVKKRLTDISVRYPPEQQFAGLDFFPRKNVEFLSDQILKWSKANILRLDELAISAPDDAKPPEVELVLAADDSYQCRIYAVRAPDKVITKKNADPAVDYDVERALMVRQRLDQRLEYLRVNQTLRSTSVMTNNTTLTSAQRWDNTTSPSNLPVTFGRNVVENMRLLNGGNPPNVVRMTGHVKNAIVRSEEFKDFTKFNVADRSAPIGDEDLIASIWGLAPGSVRVCDATYNSAPAGATAAYKAFFGSDVVFGYVIPAGMRNYGLSTEFRFSGYNTDPYAILSVPQFDRGIIPGEDIRGISICDPHIINPDSGYLVKGCVDTTDAQYGSFLD
jgi:hypothetical protein